MLASCRDTIDEIHGKNLDLESKVESLTRKNKRLESSEKKLQDKCRILQEELLKTKEQLENEKRMHKTTKNKVQLLNQKERYAVKTGLRIKFFSLTAQTLKKHGAENILRLLKTVGMNDAQTSEDFKLADQDYLYHKTVYN